MPAWIDQILAGIVVDEKYQAGTSLLERTGITRDQIAGTVQVIRREIGGEETEERVRRNLASLEAAYERFWERLNRDAVVNLTPLNETIDFTLTELTRSR